ncbi:MAG: undecaprenyl-diphosphate phosphatase [Candidatus Omnitrophota bacterium]
MTLTESLISGLVQGLTEFLPISSSAHLVFVHRAFGITGETLFFDICLHAATLAAVMVYFRKDIAEIFIKKDIKAVGYIILGTIPAVAAALMFGDKITEFFTAPAKVGAMLLVTATALFLAQTVSTRKERTEKITLTSAVIVGITQAFALLPGISRSGVTIASGMVSGVKAESAFRFSFLLSVPVIAGALAYKIVSMGQEASSELLMSPGYVLGMAVAFLAGLAGLRFFRYVLILNRIYLFGVYCLLMGGTILLLAG